MRWHLLALLSALATVGCGANAPGNGKSLIESVALSDRIKSVSVVSVNGRKTKEESPTLREGENRLRVRFSWPQGGEQDVSLKFRAQPKQKYYLRYDPFPPTADQFSGESELLQSAEGLAEKGLDIMIARSSFWPEALIRLVLGAATMAPAVPMKVLDLIDRVKETAGERRQPVEYVDLWIVSENGEEGVVRRVRAYPDGRLKSAPWWDEYYYSPGCHYRRFQAEDEGRYQRPPRALLKDKKDEELRSGEED